MIFLRTKGSPPVSRSFRTPLEINAEQSRPSSSSVSRSVRRKKSRALRHAINAAEIATVRHRDAQIVDAAAKSIGHRVRGWCFAYSGGDGDVMGRLSIVGGNYRGGRFAGRQPKRAVKSASSPSQTGQVSAGAAETKKRSQWLQRCLESACNARASFPSGSSPRFSA